MPTAVRASNIAFRVIWIINVILGILDAFTSVGTQTWLGLHMLIGILLVALLWFLGIAEGLQSRSVIFPLATFLVGLLIPIIGYSQLLASSLGALYTLRAIHVVLILGAIALVEVVTGRYKRALAAAKAG
ncbi:MAG TPA: hypothetical protein VKQ36_08800 [Ktedonobacterales bacterium]|nr:hypothetical protein [Ktedonobacterales bacterium]